MNDLYKAIASRDEQITELKAEILQLRVQNIINEDPIEYAKSLIDECEERELEEKYKWFNEVSEYLDVYISYHKESEEGE
jgi:hypothetical protein